MTTSLLSMMGGEQSKKRWVQLIAVASSEEEWVLLALVVQVGMIG
jgi:hypothetical protein